MNVRAYDGDIDRVSLWELKRAFELELGDETGDPTKAERYREKLSERYRSNYLRWVDRCVAEDDRCVQVADAGDGRLAGYAFVLPESLAFIWDAAVLNELYVHPEDRGSGVADDLLKAAIAVAKAQTLPLERIVLDVDRANERARGFYSRHGFEHWGEMVARPLG